MVADNTLAHAYTNTSTKTEILLRRGGHTVRGGKKDREREQSLVTNHRGEGRVEGRGERMLFFFDSLFRVVL